MGRRRPKPRQQPSTRINGDALALDLYGRGLISAIAAFEVQNNTYRSKGISQ